MKLQDNVPETAVAPEEWRRALQTPVRFLKGVGPKRAGQLERLGLNTVEDLIYHLPFRYEDRRQIQKIREAAVGSVQSFVGRLVSMQKKFIPRRRAQFLLGTLADDSGAMNLVWYRAPAYLSQALAPSQRLLVHGRVEPGMGSFKRIIHPEFEILDPERDRDLERIRPVYWRPGGVPLSAMRTWISQALEQYGCYLPNCLPQAIARRQRLPDLRRALIQVHRPGRNSDCGALNRFSSAAHRSIIFDELFYLQLGLGLRKKSRLQSGGISFRSPKPDLTRRMRTLLPFSLTRAQERVASEVFQDMASEQPMHRMIQGDVGSGKTMVAWFAALRALENGYQAVWMAPTELLAEQHFFNLKGFADALGVRSALLTGSLPAKEKKAILEGTKQGEVGFIVGTHALVQEGVQVPRLGLGVIDEQHRFGVLQRMTLQKQGGRPPRSSPRQSQPDVLLMSATPIPRSLALILYGDMEVSFLDEMPPGREPIRTKVFSEAERREVYGIVREELQSGHQAFIVYPLVEASEQMQEVRDATRMADALARGAFRGIPLGLVHGKMIAAERDRVMRSFRDGRLQLLVATTVIEVGVDIPNATVMVVEHAERFGLSQLHQLRGRVGRGRAPGRCLLVGYGSLNSDAASRLRVMEREQDGFKIAEADLALRGPGEFLGTRQSGLADFRLANLMRDSALLVEARREASEWLRKDPMLQSPESQRLRQVLSYRWGRKLELGAVG